MNPRMTPSRPNPSFSATRRIAAFPTSVLSWTRSASPLSNNHPIRSAMASDPVPLPRSSCSWIRIPSSTAPGGRV